MSAETRELRLGTHVRDGAVVVVPRGELGLGTYRRLRDHLIKVGTDCPRAVVVDLAHLHVDSSSSLALFAAVQTRLEEWPGVPLLLVADGERARDLSRRGVRIGRFVPLHATVPEALDAIGKPPPRSVLRTELPNDVTSPRAAREFTRDVCAKWSVLGAIAEDVVLVVCELVSNVVVHTASAVRLRLELRRDLLSVAVYDGTPGGVSVRDPAGRATGMHGLLLVAQVSRAWGWSPAPDGGKVVWATFRTR